MLIKIELLFHFSQKRNKNGHGKKRQKVAFIRLFSTFIRPFLVAESNQTQRCRFY